MDDHEQLPDWDDGEQEAEVPRILHSDYSGELFRTCLVCAGALDEADLHIVEKVIRNGETVMEMALCGICANNMARECSEESLETLRKVQESWIGDADPDGETCAGCGKDRDHADAFVIAGYFMPGYALVRRMSVCETCHEGVQEKLSKKTRETFGEFVENHFPGVPENIDSPVFFG